MPTQHQGLIAPARSLGMHLGVGQLAAAAAIALHGSFALADDGKTPTVPAFRLPAPAPAPTRDQRSIPPDARIGTHPDPRMHAVWLAPSLGGDLRVTNDVAVALAAEGVASVPFQIWRGAFDPAFFPTIRATWRGKSTLGFSAGFGVGIFEDREGYGDGWKTLSYTPQIAWRLTGPNDSARGFRHDLVFKPGLVHLGLAHSVWPADGGATHEIRVVIGASILEDGI